MILFIYAHRWCQETAQETRCGKSTHTGTQHSSCDSKRVLSVSLKFRTQASRADGRVDSLVYLPAWRDFPPTRAEN